MNGLNLVAEYTDIEDKLVKYLTGDGEHTPCYITNMIECGWSLNGNDLVYAVENDIYNGHVYGTSIWKKEDVTFIIFDNGCGSRIGGIFDNSKREQEIED